MNKLKLSFFLCGLALLCGQSSLQAAQPQLVSVSPSSGAGTSQTFTLTVSDTDGPADIANMNLMIDTNIGGQGSCWMYYDNTTATASVYAPQGWVTAAPNTPVTGNACTAQFLGATTSGNTVSVTFNVAFSPSFSGLKNLWGRVKGISTPETGYHQLGTWNVLSPYPDFHVSLTPASQSVGVGQTVTYNLSVTSDNGFAGIVYIYPYSSPGVNITVNGLSGTAAMNVPAGGTVTATAQVTPTSSAILGQTSVSFTFQSGSIQHGANSLLTIQSTIAPVVTVTSSAIIGPTRNFVVTATDPGGYGNIAGMNLLLNSSLDGRNACWLYFGQNGVRGTGTLALASDDGTDWSNSTPMSGSTQTANLQNTRCIIGGGPVNVTGSGNTLTLDVTLAMSPAQDGTNNIYARAANFQGGDSGYKQFGQFVSAGGPGGDFALAVTPASQTIAPGGQATWGLTLTGINGYTGTANLAVTGLPAGASVNQPPYIGAGQSASFTVNTTADTPPGAYPLTVTASGYLLTHSSVVTLIVQGSQVPVLSAALDSSSGATRTYTFSATSPDGTPPQGMNVLINDSVDGRGACWLYLNHNVMLASDDSSVWLAPDSNGNVANSQCSIAPVVDRSTGSDNLTMDVTITFQGTFTGQKNLYMASSNQQGSTGYRFETTVMTQ